MYKKVVVPLDGSKLAEAVLPHLEEIAKGCSIAEIMLVSVTEKITGGVNKSQVFEKFVPESPTEEHLAPMGMAQIGVVFVSDTSEPQQIPVTLGKMARSASDYLCRIADNLREKGFKVNATVIVGNPAEEIINFAKDKSADLIIMASQGKSRFSRWDMGNIVEKVIKASSIPVLVVKPAPGFKETKPKRRGLAV
jgi:nucleotide-binding universal stress UspA family protein